MGKNPLLITGDTGLIPDLEDPTCTPEQLSLCPTNTAPVRQSLGASAPEARGPWGPQQEEPPQ